MTKESQQLNLNPDYKALKVPEHIEPKWFLSLKP